MAISDCFFPLTSLARVGRERQGGAHEKCGDDQNGEGTDAIQQAERHSHAHHELLDFVGVIGETQFQHEHHQEVRHGQ